MIRAVCTVSGCGRAAVDLVTAPGPSPVARVACDAHRNTVAGDLVAGGAGAYAVGLRWCTVMRVSGPACAPGTDELSYRVILAADVVTPGAAMLRCVVPAPAPAWVREWLETMHGVETPADVVAGTCSVCRMPGPVYVLDYAGPAADGAAYRPERVCHRH